MIKQNRLILKHTLTLDHGKALVSCKIMENKIRNPLEKLAVDWLKNNLKYFLYDLVILNTICFQMKLNIVKKHAPNQLKNS